MEIEIRFRVVRNFEKVAAVRMQNNGVRFLLHFVSLHDEVTKGKGLLFFLFSLFFFF